MEGDNGHVCHAEKWKKRIWNGKRIQMQRYGQACNTKKASLQRRKELVREKCAEKKKKVEPNTSGGVIGIFRFVQLFEYLHFSFVQLHKSFVFRSRSK